MRKDSTQAIADALSGWRKFSNTIRMVFYLDNDGQGWWLEDDGAATASGYDEKAVEEFLAAGSFQEVPYDGWRPPDHR